MRRFFLSALTVLLVLPQALLAQSLIGTRGLGLPLEALDGRSRALGSVGTGLFGSSLLPTDPASSASLYLPSIQVTLQPQWSNGELEGESQHTQGTRFPLLAVSYPVTRLNGAVSFTMSGFLDQRWLIERAGRTDLGGVDTPITDTFESNGGVSSFRLGWGQRMGETLSLGLSLGALTGSVTRTFTRTVDSVGAGVQVTPYEEKGQWQYSGVTGALGFRWDPVDVFRLGGTLTWASELDAEPAGGNTAAGTTYDLPLELRMGASGLLTPRLAVNLGFSFADWNASGQGLAEGSVVGSVWSWGGGVEWTGIERGGRGFPVRLGYRHSELPFAFQGDGPTEGVLTGGIGLDLLRTEDQVVGGLDLAVERGSRDAGSLSETFWRGTLTIKVSSW